MMSDIKCVQDNESTRWVLVVVSTWILEKLVEGPFEEEVLLEIGWSLR